MNTRIASELLKVARLIMGEAEYEYHYDPKHENQPSGGGWEKTDKGWRRAPQKDKKPKMQKGPANPHVKAKANFHAQAKIQNILAAHKLDENSDVVQEMAGFKKTLGQQVPEKDVGKWYVRNIAKLKKDFLANMSAANYKSPLAFKNAQKTIKDMPNGDFGKVLAAIHADDEEV